MKTIPLTQGYSAIVDDQDYQRVANYKWHARVITSADGSVRVYAQRDVINHGGCRTSQQLHRFILAPADGTQIDHKNGNPLDNSRANLRLCTHTENMRNRMPQTGGTSKYKGVRWHKRDAKWEAKIRVNGKQKFLGYFVSELDAARAYDAAAMKYFGEFARINFPGGVCK